MLRGNKLIKDKQGHNHKKVETVEYIIKIRKKNARTTHEQSNEQSWIDRNRATRDLITLY